MNRFKISFEFLQPPVRGIRALWLFALLLQFPLQLFQPLPEPANLAPVRDFTHENDHAQDEGEHEQATALTQESHALAR